MDANELFKQERFAECLAKCETELRFATSAQIKFALNVLGSQAALKQNDLDKAVAMAEMAIKLDDSKMNAWQAMTDAWRAKNDPRLGDSLTKQMIIAKKNQKFDRALQFAKEAARSFENSGKWTEVVSRWRDAEELSGSELDVECLEGLASAYEHMGIIGEAESVLWQICEVKQDVGVAVRLLSRPSHVILESKRTNLGEASDIQAAWNEFIRRVDRLALIFDSRSSPLIFASRAIIHDALMYEVETEELLQTAVRIIMDPTAHEAFKARAWFCLAREALNKGDPISSFYANQRGEQLEQVTYALATSSQQQSSTGIVMIGTITTQTKPFSGTEVYSLVCMRTATTHITAGRAALTALIGGIQNSVRAAQRQARDGLTWLGKSRLDNTTKTEQLRELSKHADWIRDLCNCTRGPVTDKNAEAQTISGDHASILFPRLDKIDGSLMEAFIKLSMDESVEWYYRRMSSLAELICQAKQLESNEPFAENPSAIWKPEILSFTFVADQFKNESSFGPDRDACLRLTSNLRLLWLQRMEFAKFQQQKANNFSAKELQRIVDTDPDAFPLACEILGKFLMGYNLPLEMLPEDQPGPKQVRDPASAVKYLQKAITLDPLGIGAAAPLANAFHAAKKEPEAALLYQSILDQLANSAEVHPSNPYVASWAWTRLAQQQLYHGKYPNAAASFQRALGAFSRADMSTNLTAWSGLAEAHMRMGRLGAAAQAFEKTVSIISLELQTGLVSSDRNEKENMRCAFLIKLATVRTKLGEASKASEPLQEVIQSTSCDQGLRDIAEIDLAESLLEQGRYLQVRGAKVEAHRQYAESQRLFESYRLRIPASSQALKGLGDVYTELGNNSRARIMYMQCCYFEPWEALARYDLARQLLISGESAGAVRMCEASLVLNPVDPVTWNLLGVARAKSGAKEDVLVRQHLHVRSLQLDSQGSSAAWLNLAWTLLGVNRNGLAKRAFSQAQTIDADSAVAWLGHSMLAEKEKSNLKLPALDCAVDASMYGADACALDAMLLFGQTVCNESVSGFAFQSSTKLCDFAMRLLDVSGRAIQLAEGVSLLKQAVGWSMSGISLVALEAKQQALEAFEKSAELFLAAQQTSEADRVLVNLAVLCDPPEAGIQVCEMAGQRSKELQQTYEYWAIFGNLWGRCGDHAKAKACFERSIDLCKSLESAELRGLVLNSLRVKLVRAASHLDDVASLFPLVEVICEEGTAFLPRSLQFFQELSEISPSIRLLVQERAMNFPPLSISNENADAASALVQVCFGRSEDPLVNCRLFPWRAEAWAEASSISRKASVASLKLSEKQHPKRIETIVHAGKAFVEHNANDAIQETRDNGCYWISKTELKLKFLCPWQTYGVAVKAA